MADDIATNPQSTLFSPLQILRDYSKGEIDIDLALVKLGLDHQRQLMIAMADAELSLPGTDDTELNRQAKEAEPILRAYLKPAFAKLPGR